METSQSGWGGISTTETQMPSVVGSVGRRLGASEVVAGVDDGSRRKGG